VYATVDVCGRQGGVLQRLLQDGQDHCAVVAGGLAGQEP